MSETDHRVGRVPVDEETCSKPQSEPVEATWAPADPRDKLYDAHATGAEKSVSLLRIVAAFHPVLNLPVLLYDLVCRVGVGRFLAAFGLLIFLVLLYSSH